MTTVVMSDTQNVYVAQAKVKGSGALLSHGIGELPLGAGALTEQDEV